MFFSSEHLRSIASSDRNISKLSFEHIEDVDIVGNAVDIGGIIFNRGEAGTYDYILSSHNFEHLPNPILFLQGCSLALKRGGILTMAIPDGRSCFDHFRYPTRLSEWLEAYFEKRRKPTPAQIFDSRSVRADYLRQSDLTLQPGCSLAKDDPSYFQLSREFESSFSFYKSLKENPENDYIDAHCSVLYGDTLELLLLELNHLGLIDVEIVEISPTNFHEFYIHIRNGRSDALSVDDFYKKRSALLERISYQIGRSGFGNVSPIRS